METPGRGRHLGHGPAGIPQASMSAPPPSVDPVGSLSQSAEEEPPCYRAPGRHEYTEAPGAMTTVGLMLLVAHVLTPTAHIQGSEDLSHTLNPYNVILEMGESGLCSIGPILFI